MAVIERMLGLYRDLYRGFTVSHFHEQLRKRHNYGPGYTVTKLHRNCLYGAFRCQVVSKMFGLLLRGMTLRHS